MNMYCSYEVINNVLLNVFWGISWVIDGFEIGGIGNIVFEDMWGFQMVGVFNYVWGNIIGI